MTVPARHYGLDWLRIGAFAILILYHVGLVFVPWGFHARLPGADWVAIPLMISNPWRLALLFVVSGYATRALLARQPAALAFMRDRSARLLVPLAFGVLVVVPPQVWVELTTQHGYADGFATFMALDYLRFTPIDGIFVPAWNHLWFVAYLWLYTAIAIAACAAAPRAMRSFAQHLFDGFAGGHAALIVPMAWMVAVTSVLFAGHRETHLLAGDWVAHASYFPTFVFGFALAGSPRTLSVMARWWKVMLVIAIIAFAVAATVEFTHPIGRGSTRLSGRMFSIARGVQGWATIAALLGIADRYWNRDAAIRPMLTEAVFPFYLIHQTIIVVGAYALMSWALPGWANFVLLVTMTIAGCWAFYLIGRRIGWLRPLIGLRRVDGGVSRRVLSPA